jgi:tight adherence protein C
MLLLLTGLALFALAVALLARAAALSRVRVTEALGGIDAYGFEARARTPESAAGPVREAVDGVASALGAYITSRLGAGDERELRRELRSAGFYRLTIRTFVGYRVLAGGVTTAIWLWWTSLLGWSTVLVLFAVPIVGLMGWQLPLIFVRNRARARLAQIDDDLPELVDLLVVTVEAGVGFNSSLQTAADRLRGPLGDELRLTLQEQRMGLSTNESLRNLLERCDTPGIRSFVRSILQGETLGISIGEVMRELAMEMRKRRRAKAEERAQKAPIKILFPLIFLIFPAMFIVLLAPAVFAILDAF